MLNYFDHPITSASAKVSNTKKKFLEHNLEGVQTLIMFFLDSQIFLLNAKKQILLIDPKIFKIKLLYLTNETNKL